MTLSPGEAVKENWRTDEQTRGRLQRATLQFLELKHKFFHCNNNNNNNLLLFFFHLNWPDLEITFSSNAAVLSSRSCSSPDQDDQSEQTKDAYRCTSGRSIKTFVQLHVHVSVCWGWYDVAELGFCHDDTWWNKAPGSLMEFLCTRATIKLVRSLCLSV